MHTPTPEDIRALRRDKYGDDPDANLTEDLGRLAAGEPLAYVIGWIPFLGLKIHLDSRPLIPRPETEWWTEKLIAHLHDRFGTNQSFSLLDLCAGSGAIGLAILKAFPHAHVSFGELDAAHTALIKKNLEMNGLDAARADIRQSDVFSAFDTSSEIFRFDIIATNPPYIPADRELESNVTDFEPAEALYSGADGLDIIRRIVADASTHLLPMGEVWIECDIANAEETKGCAEAAGFDTSLHTDQYGRPRLVVAYLKQ